MEDYDATGEHHLDQKKQHQIFKQRIFKKISRKKPNSIMRTIKRKYEKKRNAAKIRTHVMTRIKGIEKETEKQ